MVEQGLGLVHHRANSLRKFRISLCTHTVIDPKAVYHNRRRGLVCKALPLMAFPLPEAAAWEGGKRRLLSYN